jgi:hypothetical protein
MDLPPPEHPKVPRWDLGLRWCFMEISPSTLVIQGPSRKYNLIGWKLCSCNGVRFMVVGERASKVRQVVWAARQAEPCLCWLPVVKRARVVGSGLQMIARSSPPEVTYEARVSLYWCGLAISVMRSCRGIPERWVR